VAAAGLGASIGGMTTRRIGILGGTFDPIHLGHLDVGAAAESALALTEVIVVTANIPPHRPDPAASSYHRFAMVALAVNGRERWRASDLELERPSRSYTTGTLQSFHDLGFSPGELFFLIGADAFAEIETWKDFPAFLDRAHFAVVSRPGYPVAELRDRLPKLAGRMIGPSDSVAQVMTSTSIFLIDAATADVSGTAIRQRCATGGSIAEMVPPMVREHIERHGLYSSASPRNAAVDFARTQTAGRLHGQN
jgi:nicotinate-nucleotide adenylyltransferase